jgi:hypothetical protein
MFDVYNIAWIVLFINLVLINDDLRFLLITLMLSNINMHDSVILNMLWFIIITLGTIFIPFCNWTRYIDDYDIYLKKNILVMLLFTTSYMSYIIYDYNNSSIFYSIMIYPLICFIINMYFFIIKEREIFMILNIIINIFLNIGLFQIINGFIYI